MLGRRVSVLGDVVRGEARGRELGFPTANLDLHHELHPPPGVYACLAHHVDEEDPTSVHETFRAVTNVGFRPTVEPDASAATVEVHLLDFEGDLYGEHVEVEFVRRLRDEARFPDLDALRTQIARDVAEARRVLPADETHSA
jgi:riboflavin kinase/FMN adenylyltransferase